MCAARQFTGCGPPPVGLVHTLASVFAPPHNARFTHTLHTMCGPPFAQASTSFVSSRPRM